MSSFYYEGKMPCQGCGRPGNIIKRDNKNSLCIECSAIFISAKCQQFEKHVQYETIRDWYNGYAGMTFDDKSLDDFATKLLQLLHNRFVQKTFNDLKITKRGKNIHGSVHYTIPFPISRLIIKFLDTLDIHCRYIYNKRKEADEYMQMQIENSKILSKVELEKEADRIYNEGIKKGKDLLQQLNNGAITIEQLNNNYSYSQAPQL